MSKSNKVILIIRDGWGYRKDSNMNAISSVNPRNNTELMNNYPNTLLKCSGEAVGLPKGYQGNSEVGHMTIGSGRIIYQSLERINHSIADGTFFKNKELLGAIENCKKNKTSLHLIGLLQTEGVHSHLNHLLALLDLCKKQNFKRVWIHIITDGRDAPIHASLKHIKTLQSKLKKIGFGKIATISGRFYAMDRDKRWDRTREAYDCIVSGKVDSSELSFTNPEATIKESHAHGISDEFIVPRKFKDYSSVKENDSIIFYNFRTDRTRQLTRAIVEKNFEGWKRKPLRVRFVGMTQFYSPMSARVAFKDASLKNLLGEIVSANGKRQLRISETEKYAHVTFFFNGQIEKAFPREERVLVPSPKVRTYDLKPEMSAYPVTERLLREIQSKKYQFIVVNLVNCDMVGHTGNEGAIRKAIIAVDDCTGEIVRTGLKQGYTSLVFADHGNAEDQTDKWRTSHTTNKVPLIVVSNDNELKHARLSRDAGLVDIAPTVLELMGLKKPREMTGKSIIL